MILYSRSVPPVTRSPHGTFLPSCDHCSHHTNPKAKTTTEQKFDVTFSQSRFCLVKWEALSTLHVTSRDAEDEGRSSFSSSSSSSSCSCCRHPSDVSYLTHVSCRLCSRRGLASLASLAAASWMKVGSTSGKSAMMACLKFEAGAQSNSQKWSE